MIHAAGVWSKVRRPNFFVAAPAYAQENRRSPYFCRAARQYITTKATRIATDRGIKWYRLSAVVVNVANQGIANMPKKTSETCLRAPAIRDGATNTNASKSWMHAAAATATTATGPISADAFDVIKIQSTLEATVPCHEFRFLFARMNLARQLRSAATANNHSFVLSLRCSFY
jgi:hypothetical protein